jgi:hypothetical protein
MNVSTTASAITPLHVGSLRLQSNLKMERGLGGEVLAYTCQLCLPTPTIFNDAYIFCSYFYFYTTRLRSVGKA